MDISCIKGAICLAYHGQCGSCPLYIPKAKIGPNRTIIDMPRLTVKDVGRGSVYEGRQTSICEAINRYRIRGELPREMIRAIETIFKDYEKEIKQGIPENIKKYVDEAYLDMEEEE